jgi:membrane protein YdbS with pleckstrin-like domain
MMNSAPETEPSAAQKKPSTTGKNPSVTADDPWLAVDSAYLKYMRISYLIAHGMLLIFALFWIFINPDEIVTRIAAAVAAITVLSFVWCSLFLAPRRFIRIRYCMRELDVNYQSGYLFWKSVSVSINRVQHIEVNQGPIQRRLGIAVLSIYTAGTMGSDMKIPGLAVEDANTIKSRLLNAINSEEPEDDAE